MTARTERCGDGCCIIQNGVHYHAVKWHDSQPAQAETPRYTVHVDAADPRFKDYSTVAPSPAGEVERMRQEALELAESAGLGAADYDSLIAAIDALADAARNTEQRVEAARQEGALHVAEQCISIAEDATKKLRDARDRLREEFERRGREPK